MKTCDRTTGCDGRARSQILRQSLIEFSIRKEIERGNKTKKKTHTELTMATNVLAYSPLDKVVKIEVNEFYLPFKEKQSIGILYVYRI